MTADELNAFMSDGDLAKMLEEVKISDDILDVIKLSENQHSDMLAWCLNPNEGHAQGDAVVKDLLISAHGASSFCTYDNKKFFEAWTPARIRRSNFGAAFLTREFKIQLDDMGASGRLDLFIVDPQNKILVAIENKVGAKLTSQQLTTYCERVNKEFGSRPVFSDFQFAYIVLDRDLRSYTEEEVEELGTRWTFLDYTWLEASADRARRHLVRNNEAAQLLMAYCQKQTGWENAAQQQLSEIAADFSIRHEIVVKKLREISKQKITTWTPATLRTDLGDLCIFYQQNRPLCRVLFEASGIGAVRAGLMRSMSGLTADRVQTRRTWMALATERMHELLNDEEDDPHWPIFVNIFREGGNDLEVSKFTVRFVWCKELFKPGFDVEGFKSRLAKDFPELKRFAVFKRRRVVIARNASATAAIKAAILLAEKIDAALEPT